MVTTLTVGEKANQCLWIRKSQTDANDAVLHKLHKLGMTSKMNGNKLFLMMTLRFLQKDEVITQDHLDIYNALDKKHFSEEMPTREEEDVSPFPPWRPPTYCSDNNSGEITKNLNEPTPEPKPEPKPDPDPVSDDEDDIGLIDLFA